ncbi:IS1634 family transposase [Neochlamydia sp. S13]|uniref:IS1634 family transposase n=1 Tax=Neochlamydia sp. S13 TaxID=1353976 RepID=UPI00102E9CD1|nr:IS1634 family transposase [Neochlamydia sp. S13]
MSSSRQNKYYSKRSKQEPGRPKKEQALLIQYRMEAALAKDEQKISNSLQRKGKFILATNELNAELLSNDDLLDNYKGQQSVERGFRFLKDPLFMTSSVFLKNEQRIIALAMIMCLCLLVYTLTQRHLRQQLEKLSTSIPNQLGKSTNMPTLRWIFQVFEGVHLLIKRTPEGIKELILNLNPNMRHILQVLGPPFQKLYANGN